MPLTTPGMLETPRLRIRPVAASDLADLLALYSDEMVTRFLGQPSWKTMADAEAWFQRISAVQAAGTAREFVILARQTGSILGRCGLFEFEAVNAHATVGYVLGRAYWRQGYMREALSALIDCAFNAMALRRLEARVEAPNIASANLLQRLGFTREGVLRERWITNGETTDANIYGLLRNEWLGHRGVQEAQLPNQALPATTTTPGS